MRISDWSSDVCSSDLDRGDRSGRRRADRREQRQPRGRPRRAPEGGGRRVIAAVEAWRAGLMRRGKLLPNIIAGVMVGVVALPLAMAIASATGVKQEKGMDTAIRAGVALSVLGGSRVQGAGRKGAITGILAG